MQAQENGSNLGFTESDQDEDSTRQIAVRMSSELHTSLKIRLTHDHLSISECLRGLIEQYVFSASPPPKRHYSEQEQAACDGWLEFWRHPKKGAEKDLRDLICRWRNIPLPE